MPDSSTNPIISSYTGHEAHDDVVVELKRLPLWTLNLSLLGAVAVALALSLLSDMAPLLWEGRELSGADTLVLRGTCMWLGLWLALIAKRLVVRRMPFGPIVFSRTSVRLPKGPEAIRHHELPYSDITSIIEGGNNQGRHFFIESAGRVYQIAQRTLVQPGGAEIVVRELRLRLNQLPEGPKRLFETELRRKAVRKLLAQRPWATQALLGMCAVFFLNTWLKGALSSPFGLLRWGANAQALVARGDWYRLAAANFLHGHWLHVVMNGLALWFLGNLLERLLGWQRFILVYLSAGIVAMGASALMGHAIMSVGASGAIFGLLGGFALVSVRLREVLPLGVRQTPRWWITMIGINALLPLLWPTVDITAHITGFLCGGIITFAMIGRSKRLVDSAGRTLTVCAIALAALVVAALGQAVVRAADTTATGETQIAQLLLADPRSDAATLNTLALLWVIDPESTPAHILAAQDSAREAARREPDVAEFRATLASAQKLSGELEAAAQSWHAALNTAHSQQKEEGQRLGSRAYSAPYAQQLVHTLQAMVQRDAKKAQPPMAAASINKHGNSWWLQVPANCPASHVGYYLVATNRGSPVALVFLRISDMFSSNGKLPSELAAALDDAGAAESSMMFIPTDEPNKQAVFSPSEPWTLWRLPLPRPQNSQDDDS